MRWAATNRATSPQGVGEDRFTVIETGAFLVIVVADGAGGQPGGAEAAEIVVRSVQEAVPRLDSGALAVPETWRALLLEIDAAIAEDPSAGETTAVVAALSSFGIVGAGVGDTEAWLVTANAVEDLTRHQSRKPFLGDGAWPQTFSAQGSGTLLVATDGLFKYTDEAAILGIIRSEPLDRAAEKLVELVRLPSGDLWDDATVVLARV